MKIFIVRATKSNLKLHLKIFVENLKKVFQMAEISSDTSNDSDTSYAIGENDDSEFSDVDLNIPPRKSKNKKRNGPIINDVGRSKRARKSPSRHGNKDSNYNDLISTLSSSSTSSTVESSPKQIVQNEEYVYIINDSPQSPINNPKENVAPDLLQLILKKLDTIENFLIRLDVKVNVMDGIRPRENVSDRLGVINLNDLKSIGLPVSDCDGLNQLEQKINDNGEFRTKFVSCRICFKIENKFTWI